MTLSSRKGYFKLAKQSGGVGCYAEVEVCVTLGETLAETQIAWEKEAVSWWDGEFGRGARRGIAMALDAYPEAVSEVLIRKIQIMPVDSTEDCVAYAACFAVWDALRVCGCDPPRWERGTFHFPENP